jgi:hypothetical protein
MNRQGVGKTPLPDQHRHKLAVGKGGGHEGRELGPIAHHPPDTKLINGLRHLFSMANNPNLHFVASPIGQQFIEFCRHFIDLANG